MEETATMVKFQAEEVIIQEGRSYDEMYKIISGSVAVYMRYGEEDEHLLGIYSKSRCFGEINVFSRQPCIYTVVAYNEVLLMRITRDSMEGFIKRYPGNAIDIMQNMVRSFELMQKNIDLLLDEIYEKQDVNQKLKQTEELKNKIMRYSISGLDMDYAKFSNSD